MTAIPAAPRRATTISLLIPLLIGAVVAVAIGVYGRVHQPVTDEPFAGFGNTGSPLVVKAVLATIVVVLAIVQLLSALAIYGRFGRAPAWIGPVHRWSGRLAFVISIPVAMQCLYTLGFQVMDTRVLLHSLLGCLFYGAFVCKMLLLRKQDSPGWVLPVAGGVVFTALVGIWLTSALWLFTT